MPGRLRTYGYVNAKIRARLSELFTEKEFGELIKAPSAEEAVQLLRDSAYAKEISAYASTGDVRAVEFALMVHEMTLLQDLVKDLPGKAGEFTTTLLLRYETETVKNALRLWFERYIRGRNIAGGSSYLYTEPIVHEIDYDAMVDAGSSSELAEALEGTPYREPVEARLAEVESQRHIFPVEISLDRYYFSRLTREAESLPGKDREAALRITGVEVDLLNIDRIVRFVSFYRPGERTRLDIFLPGGRIDPETLRKAYGIQEAEDALVTLLGDTYGEYRSMAGQYKSNPYTRLHMIEEILKQILYDEVRRLLRGYPFTVGTVLAYLFLKRKEVRSIVRLLNAKQYGLSEERIREVL